MRARSSGGGWCEAQSAVWRASGLTRASVIVLEGDTLSFWGGGSVWWREGRLASRRHIGVPCYTAKRLASLPCPAACLYTSINRTPLLRSPAACLPACLQVLLLKGTDGLPQLQHRLALVMDHDTDVDIHRDISARLAYAAKVRTGQARCLAGAQSNCCCCATCASAMAACL